MARHTVITDDMDGSPDAQTITFRVDGQDYEIDLSSENREKFRQALAPYLAKSRLIPTGRSNRSWQDRWWSSADEEPGEHEQEQIVRE